MSLVSLEHGNSVEPILKWPGGKRWIAPVLRELLNCELTGCYYEPFLGGASAFLALAPKNAVLSDSNSQLIEFYKTCVDRPEGVVRAARRHRNSAKEYYRVRSKMPRGKISRAGRFLYLNKTCWGGIFRLNRKGEFNVPYANSGRAICSKRAIVETSKVFASAKLLCCDFESAFKAAGAGDVIFADPPYTARGQFNGFIRYNEKLFSWNDQLRLSKLGKKAKHRGVFIIVCSSFHREVLALYKNWWAVEINRNSLVARSPLSRVAVSECLIISRKPKTMVKGIRRITDEFLRTIPLYK